MRRRPRPPLEQILAVPIRVPPDRLDVPIDSLAMSSRLSYVLRHAPRVHVLSDLDARTLGQVADARPLGVAVLLELYELLADAGAVTRVGAVRSRRPRGTRRPRALARSTRSAPADIPAVRKVPSRSVVTKADFVRSLPRTMPPKLVVAAARKRGLSIALGYVYEVRGPSPMPAPRRPSPDRPGERGRGLVYVSDRAAILHALMVGPGTIAEIVDRIHGATDGALALAPRRVHATLRDMEEGGHVQALQRKPPSQGSKAGRWPYRFGITAAGRRAATEHRSVLLGILGLGDARP